MEKVNIEMIWGLKSHDLKVADAMMKRMLKALNKEELELIGDCKISKTMLEVSVNGDEDPNHGK